MSGKASYRKLLKAIREAAADQGWSEQEANNGVYLVPPNKAKAKVRAHFTPSDYRSEANLIGDFRRSGGIWPWTPKQKGNK